MNSRIQFSEVGTTTDGKQLFAVGVLPSNAPQHAGRCSECGHVRGDPRPTVSAAHTRRPMSKAARKHISDAMKARHAAVASGANGATEKPAKRSKKAAAES